MRNVSGKSCRENQTHILCSVTFYEKQYVYEIMWKYMAQPDRPRRMRNACWIPKATNIYSENVIFIAFPGQKWLRERLSVTLDAGPNRIVMSV
jgi:hypothetical protein